MIQNHLIWSLIYGPYMLALKWFAFGTNSKKTTDLISSCKNYINYTQISISFRYMQQWELSYPEMNSHANWRTN